ncbi:elongation factor G [Garciella nitratireducens]|uniref:Elongation factor G n=1 Tax=Garciella nitratireducens DSM 15102 TaxID=1121911 RepID=A0A1T4PN88_9FIRM|nr:elongation factor G [Garciella nitratireducens]SJZ92368.1 elongation factor G [Garciella nitratireducens DSM 15102]
MKVYETQYLRNIGIIGHGSCGKTTLTEAMAFDAGLVDRIGKVEEGSTISDYDPEEIKRKISISTSLVPLQFRKHKLNLLDIPGYFDFIGEMITSFRIIDNAVIVIDAVSGMEVGTEKACSFVKDHKVPSIIFINKMDRENADFKNILKELTDFFGNIIVPFEIPMKNQEGFEGTINVLDMKGQERKAEKCIDVEISEDIKREIQFYRQIIMEAVAQTSEELLEKYLDGKKLTNEEFYNGLRNSIIEGELIPVICGSAILNIGIETLINMLIDFFPSPKDVKPINVINQEKVKKYYDTSEPFSAFVFKTIADPYVGKLSIFKVMSGSLTPNKEIYNITQQKKEKFNHIYLLKGKKQIEVEELNAGDIGAVLKLQYTATGDTLCDPENSMIFKAINFPEPTMSQAIFPKAKGDEDKLGIALQRLKEEDPTFKVSRNLETKETLLLGLGEVHFEVIRGHLQNKFGVEVELKDPKIPYRETIKGKAKAEGKYKKQSGGRGQYGHVFLKIEPIENKEEKEFEFVDKVVGGAVPKQFIPAVEKGLRECIKEGVLARYPVMGVQFTLYDGSFHSVDSDEISFKRAASLAYKKGMQQANPILLEPIYYVEIIVPENYMGEIIGDLNKKRGKVLGMDPVERKQKIIAEVPLAEMIRYTTELRAMTQDRGKFTMNFIRYQEVPDYLSQKIIDETKKGMKSI